MKAEAIAKGHRWQTQLESGEYASLEGLAKDVGCDRTCVGRMLRLTSLAPDIIEAILRGDLSRRSGLARRSGAKTATKTDEPDGLPRRSRQAETGLSLEKLRKHLPGRWEEQRERLVRPANR